MQKGAAIAACAALLSMALVAEAEARGRSWNAGGSVTGPRGGTTTWQRSGQCSGGTCTRSGTATGPGGGTRSWEQTRACSGGSCTSQGSYTGPGGKHLDAKRHSDLRQRQLAGPGHRHGASRRPDHLSGQRRLRQWLVLLANHGHWSQRWHLDAGKERHSQRQQLGDRREGDRSQGRHLDARRPGHLRQRYLHLWRHRCGPGRQNRNLQRHCDLRSMTRGEVASRACNTWRPRRGLEHTLEN